MSDSIDLGLSIVDHQLLDKEGRRCGKVDDLAIEGGPGEKPQVTAIFSGRRRRVRIPWEDVDKVSAHVQLKGTAPELGLGRGDDRLRPFIERIPGADR